MNDSAADNGQALPGLPIRNFGLSLASKVVSLVAHLVFVMVTVRVFKKEEVAAIAVAGIATVLLEVCKGMGLGTLLLKRFPQIENGTQSLEGQRLLATYLFYSFVPPVVLTLAAMLAPGELLQSVGLDSTGHGHIFRWGLVVSLFTVLSNTNMLALQAAQEFGRLAVLNLATAACQRLLPCLAALWLGMNLESFMMWTAASTAVGFAWTCVPLAERLDFTKLRLLGWADFWPQTRYFFGTSLLRYGATQVDQLFVAVLFPPATLAVYYMLRRLYSLAVVMIGSMIDALVPDLARQAGSDEQGARRRLTEWARLSLFAGSAGAALMAGNGSAVMEILLGPGYGDDPVLIAIFAATTSLYFLYSFVQVDLLLFQAPHKVLWMAAATAAANLLVGPLTSRWLGVHSIPLSMLAGYFLGLMAARWKGPVPLGPCKRPVWRIRELGAGFGVVTLASLAPIAAHQLQVPEWERVAVVNFAICGLVAAHFWRNRVGESLRKLGQPTV